MRSPYRLFAVALNILLAVFVLHGQDLPRQLRCDTITTRDGLSSSSVSHILQSPDGIIWIATQAGLNRYDGIEFSLYENDPFDKNSLSHNLIQTMYMDPDGILWIGTYGGLNRFDPQLEEFTRYGNDPDDPDSLSNNVVVSITRDSAGLLWVGTLSGLNRLDESSGGFVRYLPGEEDGSLPDKVVRSLTVDQQGDLWVGTYGGLSRYLPGADKFENFGSDPADKSTLPSPYVMSIVADNEDSDRLWIGTWGGGLSLFDRHSGVVNTWELPVDEVYQLLQDSQNRLWAGTWGGGLILLDPRTDELLHVTNQGSMDKGRLSHNIVYSLFEDASGLIWIGTNGGGINTFADWENQYNFLVHDPDDPGSLAAGKVESFWEDADGTLWIGVYSGGVNRYNPETGTIRHYRHDPRDPTSLSNDIVNTVYRDSRGDLWVGTNEGLNRYLPESDSFEQFYADATTFTPPEDVIFEIFEDREGTIWLGTNTSGAVRYDPDSGLFETFSTSGADPKSLSDNLVRSIVQDSQERIWIGTNNGLNLFLPETESFRRYLHDPDEPASLSSSNIRQLLEDSTGVLWVATGGGGINRYDPVSDSFSFLSRRDGLLSNHIIGLVERQPGEIWITTNLGISIYFTVEGVFQTIDDTDGLLRGDLSAGILTDHLGRVYVGGNQGITVIDGTKLEAAEYIPTLMITSFEIEGVKRNLQAEESGVFREVSLSHNENFLSFEFALLDYATPARNQYAYILEGLDTAWTYSGSNNLARYTNLDPGEYTLRVSGADSRGNWNREGIALPIRIMPPWWRTGYAYLAYGMLFVLLMFSVVYLLHRHQAVITIKYQEQQRLNHELELKVKERTAEIEESRRLAEEASRAKSLFLANMSHEIRTPLNGIFGMLSLLSSSKLDGNQQVYLDNSRQAAENLNYLVNDLLDIESIESGRLTIESQPFLLTETAEAVRVLLLPRASERELEFRIDLKLNGATDLVRGDRSRFMQILTNLISNALKYTETGSVLVRIEGNSGEDGFYLVQVIDTGIGIPADKLMDIFETFTQLDTGYAKSSRGAGLGLAIVKRLVEAMNGRIAVDSVPGKGSTFSVVLPFPAASSAGVEQQADVKKPAMTDTAPSGGTILICEDEAINRLYLATYLKAQGYSVEAVASGEAALESVRGRQFDLILMDLGLPGMDGLTTAGMIKELDQQRSGHTRHTPIIALTAHTYADDMLRCLAAGMDEFVAKPINEKILMHKIEEMIR